MVINKTRALIKSLAAESGMTMVQIVEKLNERREPEKRTTPQLLATKITRGTFRYSEAEEIAEVLGYEIVWQKKIDR